MEPEPIEKDREQRYFDYAAQCLARHVEKLVQAPTAAVHERSAAQIKAYVDRERQAAVSDQAVAFGRIENEADDETYIGRHLVRDSDGDVLVVNWQAPAAEPYFTATPANPNGLVRKRTYECHENTIVDFADVVFASPDEAMDEFLMRVLARSRTGRLRDIVATIQSTQFDIIRQPLEQALIIRGGPGTGKTVIALHRVSWLLHHHPELRTHGVLVVGPDPTFLRYVSQVLPALGETGVELRDVGALGPAVSHGRDESLALARLKGDARMATVLARALDNSIRTPDRVEKIHMDGYMAVLHEDDTRRVLTGCLNMEAPYHARRHTFRDRLVDMATETAGGPVNASALASVVERLWPRRDPAAFLRTLLTSSKHLRLAAAGLLSDAEIELLQSGGDSSTSAWTDADVALLDELDDLVNGTHHRYPHIVVDEAQDLSPMQIRSLVRRSDSGSLTLVGDILESTGPWSRDSWDDLIAHLPEAYKVHVEILHYSYRVPSRVYDFAARLHPIAEPLAPRVDVVREGPSAPTIHAVSEEERASRAVDVAVAHAQSERFVGIICPARGRSDIVDVLKARGVVWSDASNGDLGAAVNVVSPQEAKGLEFDAVVVVEPEYIVAEDPRGYRMLYIALTRTTGYLDVVCVGEPLPGALPSA